MFTFPHNPEEAQPLESYWQGCELRECKSGYQRVLKTKYLAMRNTRITAAVARILEGGSIQRLNFLVGLGCAPCEETCVDTVQHEGSNQRVGAAKVSAC